MLTVDIDTRSPFEGAGDPRANCRARRSASVVCARVVHISWGSNRIKHSEQAPSVCCATIRVNGSLLGNVAGVAPQQQLPETSASIFPLPEARIQHPLFGRFDETPSKISSWERNRVEKIRSGWKQREDDGLSYDLTVTRKIFRCYLSLPASRRQEHSIDRQMDPLLSLG